MISYRSNFAARDLKPSRHYVGKFDAPVANPPPCQHNLPEPSDYHSYNAFKGQRAEPKPASDKPLSAKQAALPKPRKKRPVTHNLHVGEYGHRFTAEQRAQVVEMLKQNIAQNTIWRTVGVSRHAVAGLAYRMRQAQKKALSGPATQPA